MSENEKAVKALFQKHGIKAGPLKIKVVTAALQRTHKKAGDGSSFLDWLAKVDWAKVAEIFSALIKLIPAS